MPLPEHRIPSPTRDVPPQMNIPDPIARTIPPSTVPPAVAPSRSRDDLHVEIPAWARQMFSQMQEGIAVLRE